MAPITPKSSRVLQVKDGNSSSQKKMKQSSLLSFFSKQPKSSTTTTKNATPKKNIDNDNATVSNSIATNANSGQASKEGMIQIKQKENDSFDDSHETNNTFEDKQISSTKKVFVEDDEDDDEDEDIKPLAQSDQLPSGRSKRNISYAESDDSDDDFSTNSRRKRTKTVPSDEDEEEYVPTKNELKSELEESDDDFVSSNSTKMDLNDSDDDILSLADKKQRTPIAVKKKSFIEAKPRSPAPRRTPSGTPKNNKFKKENEERYHWLVNETDAQGRPPSDPEYDPRTLHIPSSAWGKFTAFEKQYWEIKSKMWDCIVFFKKGKFFELYEKDAFLANSLFDWKIANMGRANMQLAGVPEMTFEYWAAQFVEHGYKVAKVDQKESMLAKEMREGTKGIIQRELECVLTSGTLTEGEMIHSDLATYCLAIREEPGNYYNENEFNEKLSSRIFGVSFIDTSTGELQILEFVDDNECTKLDTLMSQVKPKEIIIERNNLSNLANKIVKFNSAPNALFNYIRAEKEFYTFEKTYDEMITNDYFVDESKWPAVLKDYYDNSKKVGFSAFGGLLYYLKWLKLDKTLLSMGNVKEYNPIKSQNSLVLDGVTLQNLEIFSNSFDGSDKGTLFRLFNKSITPMGKRMMRTWLMHPLLKKSDIEKRHDSVDFLMNNIDFRECLERTFSKLPDLERMLSRVHACTIQVKDFERVIQGFEDIASMLKSLPDTENSGALTAFVKQIPQNLFDEVDKWTQTFDRHKASAENIIIPRKGVEPDFDRSLDDIKQLEEELNELLKKYKKQFKCSTIVYKDSGKEIYTIEMPVNVAKHVPSNWVQMAANKSTKRYYSDEVRALARSMSEARETHKLLEDDLKNRLCKKFSFEFNNVWMPTIHSVSNIDCLLALTRASESLGFPACRPTFIDEVDENTGEKLNGFLKFKSLRHPCFNMGNTNAREFIPNDIELGKDVAQLGLLTGANAAGKSTVLRITCIAVIMAQMGCYVPCEEATLSPIDRIMTRLGANDNIMQGKSTFFVELAETKKILDLATNRSLLVIDELGRGGSSSDGFAIAESVLYHVATHIQSLGYFATHYGTLGNHFKGHPQVRPMRMSIIVDEQTRNVTFLYKLEDGASEGSFGMHVASMCGIPKSIVDNAQIAADNLEHTSKLLKEKEAASNKVDGKIVTVPDGLQSDFVRLVFGDGLSNSKLGCGEGALVYDANIKRNVLKNLFKIIENIE